MPLFREEREIMGCECLNRTTCTGVCWFTVFNWWNYKSLGWLKSACSTLITTCIPPPCSMGDICLYYVWLALILHKFRCIMLYKFWWTEQLVLQKPQFTHWILLFSQLILSLPQVTKTEFLLTITIQYQVGRWWE